MSELARRLGYSATTRLVIVNCDDLGSSHAANMGVYQALRDGYASSAGLMVPAPWARHAAQMYSSEDIGVHLTLNAEHEVYRWGPITHAPSLVAGDGGFPRTISDLWEHADPEEVFRECRTQIERAIAWGIDVTHLSPHITAMTLRPEFFDVYLELAVDFRLPLRLPSSISEENVGFPFRRLAREAGILFPDFFDHDWRAGSRHRVLDELRDLPAGITEVHIQPVLDTPEIRALTSDAAAWVDDLDFVLNDERLPDSIATSGAKIIGYRELRDAMRAE